MPRPLVVHVVGARPNYMKVAPVYAALEESGAVEQRLLHTGQHYDTALNDVFFDELPLPHPHAMLEVGSGTHGEQTGKALMGLERAFIDLRPDLVIVPGDVNSTLLLTHCEEAADNLVAEGIPEERISFIGNTMIDTLLANVDDARQLAAWRRYGLEESSYLLVTLHRPALVDSPVLIAQTLASLERIALAFPVVFPMHPRTKQRP